jgi:DNA-binding MarR family transcriptional regulator
MIEDPFVVHRGLLFTVAYEMLGSAVDAEDVLQESWLRWADVDLHSSTASISKQVQLAGVAEPAGGLDPQHRAAYFTMMEVSSLLRHAVEQHLRAAGNLSYVQFELLALLSDSPTGTRRMTDLADGVVYSRSGLTYHADLLEQAGLVRRSPDTGDERGVTVTITDAGRALFARVLPGHVEVVSRLLFEPLSIADINTLTRLLTPVRDHMRRTPPRSATRRSRDKSTTD